MAVRQYDIWDPDVGYAPPTGEQPAQDIVGGFYPYTEELYKKGYTYSPSTGWVEPKPAAASVWGAATPSGGTGGRIDFSRYGQYSGAGDKNKFTPTAGIGMSAAGGGGGVQYKRPTGSVTTTRTRYTGTRPSLDLPEMDEARVKALTRKAMAPRLRNLRTALNRALVQSYENPNVRRMVVRGALESYGKSIEEARYGAERTARAEEASERDVAIKEAMATYNAAMQEYIGSAERVTTSKDIFASSTGAGKTVQSIPGVRGHTVATIWDKPPEDYFA